MPFARYVVTSVFLIIILFYISINYLIRSRQTIILYLILVFLLMTIQTFKSIDPSPVLLYGKNLIGRNISSPIFGFRDGMVYNTEFNFVDVLSNRIRSRNDKSEGIVINGGAQYFFKNIGDIGTVEEIQKIDKKNKRLEYVFVPWFGDEVKNIEFLSKYYKVTYKEEIEYNGYFVKIYNLEHE